jgi:phage gp29-like protein
MVSFPTARLDEVYTDYRHRAKQAMRDWVEREVARAIAFGTIDAAAPDPAKVRAAIGPVADDEIGRDCRPLENRLLQHQINEVLQLRRSYAALQGVAR